MNTCIFIGHKDAPSNIKPMLEDAIRDLILNRGVKQFYVGTHGAFDSMAKDVLKQFIKKYPQVNYNVVLAYFPSKADGYNDYSNTIYPNGLECVPPKFAITERNKWMIRNSDYLICYVKNTIYNAHKFKEFAKEKGKIIIEL